MSSEEEGIEYTYEEAIEAIEYILSISTTENSLIFSVSFESIIVIDCTIELSSPGPMKYFSYKEYILGSDPSCSVIFQCHLKMIFEDKYKVYRGKNIKIDFPLWNGGVNIKPVKKD